MGIAVVLVLAVLAWAWWDGGREPLRPIEQPLALPGQTPPEGAE